MGYSEPKPPHNKQPESGLAKSELVWGKAPTARPLVPITLLFKYHSESIVRSQL